MVERLILPLETVCLLCLSGQRAGSTWLCSPTIWGMRYQSSLGGCCLAPCLDEDHFPLLFSSLEIFLFVWWIVHKSLQIECADGEDGEEVAQRCGSRPLGTIIYVCATGDKDHVWYLGFLIRTDEMTKQRRESTTACVSSRLTNWIPSNFGRNLVFAKVIDSISMCSPSPLVPSPCRSVPEQDSKLINKPKLF